MTEESFVKILDVLEALLVEALPTRLAARAATDVVPAVSERHGHLLWMIFEMRAMDPAYDKTQRWLGFVQGALWDMGLCTVDQLRDMVRL